MSRDASHTTPFVVDRSQRRKSSYHHTVVRSSLCDRPRGIGVPTFSHADRGDRGRAQALAQARSRGHQPLDAGGGGAAQNARQHVWYSYL
eukprot:732933-Prymnesium_polylepis.1